MYFNKEKNKEKQKLSDKFPQPFENSGATGAKPLSALRGNKNTAKKTRKR